MSKKLIPFLSSKQKGPTPAGAPGLSSMGPKKSDDGKIVDHGNLGNLNYEIYERGVIHIYDSNLRFKKDIYMFEDELKRLNLEKMSDGGEVMIKGSGDNDHLVFSKESGEIKISLKKSEFEVMDTLKNILNKGKKLTGGSK
jgi:hypothetical protein